MSFTAHRVRGSAPPQALAGLLAVHGCHAGSYALLSGAVYGEMGPPRHLIGLYPHSEVWIADGRLHRRGAGGSGSVAGAPWCLLQEAIALSDAAGAFTPPWVGYLAYEMARSPGESGVQAYFTRCYLSLVIDGAEASMLLLEGWEAALPPSGRRLVEALLCGRSLMDALPAPPSDRCHTTPLRAAFEEREGYQRKIQDIQELIRDGWVYQVNLSQAIAIAGQLDPVALYQALFAAFPAAFSGLLFTVDRALLSLSPERFLRRRHGTLESWPIKGTAPRGADARHDEALRHDLLQSAKERAELLMITDLMRNDLARCCRPASVTVPALRQCVAYPHIYQMHSVISGAVDGALSPWQILRRCLPAGSVTGCPKEQAMDVIAQLEGRPRRSYCGAMGYLMGEGTFDFNVAIRTLEIARERALLQVGGGITIDSLPDAEYMETLYKARPFMHILGLAVP